MITPTSRRALAALTAALCLASSGCESKKTDTKDAPAQTTKQTATQTATQEKPAAAEKTDPKGEKDEVVPATSIYKAPQGDQIAGLTSPEDVRKAHTEWREAYEKTKAHEKAMAHLGGVKEGAQITVIFGTWCDDCMRDVPQLWRDLEALGDDASRIKLYYVGVDDAFGSGDADLSAYRPDAIPSFVVTRDGKEVGRVVERPETTLSNDLGRLLRGEAEGVLSASADLLVSDPARDAPPPPLPTSP